LAHHGYTPDSDEGDIGTIEREVQEVFWAYPIGHWKGDGLIIETRGLKPPFTSACTDRFRINSGQNSFLY